MRTLAAPLLAAQRSTSAAPFVQVRAIRKPAGVGRLDWERLYTGAEPEVSHGATQPADGSLVRIRISATNTVQIQRTASPGPSSDFATWPAGTGSNAACVAIASAGALVVALYADSTDGRVYDAASTDNGLTWSIWVQIAGPGTVPTVIAAAIKPTTAATLVLFDRGASISSVKDSGGWGAETPWSNSLATITGIAVQYSGDFNVAVTGHWPLTTDPGVWTCLYGDGYGQALNTWSALAELTAASAGSGVSYRSPSLAQPDVFRLFFVEQYSGTTSYNRPYFSHTSLTSDFVDNLWREPVPFNLTSTQGLALAYATGTYAWLSTPSGVWRAPLITGTGLDLTANVLSLRLRESAPVAAGSTPAGQAEVTLRNDAGQYATPGTGALLELQRGSQLSISPGYHTTSGDQVSSGPAYWIESLQYTATPGHAELVITALGGWALLRNWTSPRQITWVAGARNIYQLLAWIMARAGLELTSITPGASAACTGLYPAFTIHPGESGATAAARLLAKVPDHVFFRGGTAYIFQPTASQASAYAYVGADLVSAPPSTHPILKAEYSTASQHTNQVQATGAAVFSQDFNWTEIALLYNRIHQVHDAGLTAAADTLALAQAELRDQAIPATQDRITVRPHAGQELLDVIDVTDTRANLAAAKRRVLALQLDYDTRKGAYTHTLTLGAP